MVFERMFAEAGGYLVIPFGYEKTVNILTQINKDREAFSNITSMPDYVLVDREKEEVGYIVEVRYKSKKIYQTIQKEAREIKEKGWKKVWYFLATPEGFYLARCTDLIDNPEIIEKQKLPVTMVGQEIQEKFLKLLNDFEADH